MIRTYRLSSSRFQAASGAGAALYGGRWNRPGSEAIYTAGTRSLAALEVLVHFDVLPRDFVLTEITVPDSVRIEVVEAAALPAGWNAEKISPVTQEIGERWIQQQTSVILSVPSSIILEERNFVLNPKHPEFKELKFGLPVPFTFDSRLRGTPTQ